MRVIFKLHLRQRIISVLPIPYIAEFKGRKMDTFITHRKSVTIRAFDKPISKKSFPNTLTKIMVSFYL